MSYVVRVGNDYITHGLNYIVEGQEYVPVTGRFVDARRYKTRSQAERAAKRRGDNMYGEIKIIGVSE